MKVVLGRALFRYVFGVAAEVLALALAHAMRAAMPQSEYYVFLLAVVAVAWFGGRGPGLLAAILSPFVIDYFFLSPLHTFGISAEARPFLLPFVIAALVAAWMSSAP